jgi:hypothetical protein
MTFGTYKKKPVAIEAVKINMADHEAGKIAEWCGGRAVDEGRHVIAIDTLEGTMYADDGDWIIRGVQGEFYPCKPDIFAATYEPAADRP